MIKFKEKRLGTIYISLEILVYMIDKGIYPVLFMKFVPLSIRFDEVYTEGKIRYTGYSKEFDVINEGETAPVYDAVLSDEGNGLFKITFNRLK